MTKKIDKEAFEQYRENGWTTKQRMKDLARLYNEQVEPAKQIKSCMCSKVNRKIYHNIIFTWYDQKAN